MKITIWTLAVDTEEQPLHTLVFTDGDAAKDKQDQLTQAAWASAGIKGPYPGWAIAHDALSAMPGYMDIVELESHELELLDLAAAGYAQTAKKEV